AADHAPSSDYIERLAELGRLWGIVKFEHPALNYDGVDWDAALLKSLPRVRQAHNETEQREALNELLANLDDPETVVQLKQELEPAPAQVLSDSAVSTDEESKMAGSVLVINCELASRSGSRLGLMFRNHEANTLFAQSNAIVFDCRHGNGAGK